jgi:hypothetical protein
MAAHRIVAEHARERPDDPRDTEVSLPLSRSRDSLGRLADELEASAFERNRATSPPPDDVHAIGAERQSGRHDRI